MSLLRHIGTYCACTHAYIPVSTMLQDQGLPEGGARGTSYPGPVGNGVREDGNTHDKFFCSQAQNKCKSVASTYYL